MSDRGSWNVLLSHPVVRYPDVKYPIRGSGHVWPEKLKRPPLPSGWEISGKGGMSVGQNSSPGGMSYAAHRKGDCLRVQGVGTHPPDETERARLSGSTPSGFPKRTCGALRYPDSLREKHTVLVNITPRRIAYPIRICCPDHWLKWASLATSLRQLATAHIPLPSDGVSGRPVRTSFAWIPNNSPQSRIALVIKKLSKHQNLTQFD